MLELPRNALKERIVSFPSFRFLKPAQGNEAMDNPNLMASGTGIISWVRAALSPDLRDPQSKRRHEMLREFEEEFCRFVGFRSFALSVPPVGDELNAHVDGRPLPTSRMGYGLGECLVMMLTAKLRTELRGYDVILIEEPELHLHTRLQRQLMEYLLGYADRSDLQLVVTTHSPTVLNVVQRSGGTIYRTALDEKRAIRVNRADTSEQLQGLFREIGVSPGDIALAEKVLWVEGPHDVPVFREWMSKAPSFTNQNIPVLPVHGDSFSSDDFDVTQLTRLNPTLLVVLDSEKESAESNPKSARIRAVSKCEKNGIRCHLTDRRCTESYFSVRAVQTLYPNAPGVLDPFQKLNEQVNGFSKYDCGEVAMAMDWSEIADTDIGQVLEEFLKS